MKSETLCNLNNIKSFRITNVAYDRTDCGGDESTEFLTGITEEFVKLQQN